MHIHIPSCEWNMHKVFCKELKKEKKSLVIGIEVVIFGFCVELKRFAWKSTYVTIVRCYVKNIMYNNILHVL